MLFLTREYIQDSSGSESNDETPGLSQPHEKSALRDDSEFEYQHPQPKQIPKVSVGAYHRDVAPPVKTNIWMEEPQPDRIHTPPRNGYVLDTQPPRAVTSDPKLDKKPKEEKVSFYVPEPPVSKPIGSRPGTSGGRPGTGNSAMRAKMLAQQKNQFSMRKESLQVTSTADSRGKVMGNQPLEDLDRMLQKTTGRQFTQFSTSISGSYEPVLARKDVPMPAAISAEKTVFKSEEIEELKLDESQAVHRPASNTLQHMRRSSDTPVISAQTPLKEENKPENPAPAKQESLKLETSTFHPAKPEANKTETAPRVSLPEERVVITESRVLGLQGRELGRQPRQEPVPAPGPKTNAEEGRRPASALIAHHQRSGSMPPLQEVQEPEHIPPRPQRPHVSLQQLLASEMQDMKKFLTSPVHRDVMIQCSIRREKSGLSRFYPKYYMHLSEGYTFLLAGKKRPKNKTSNYLMSMNQKELTTKSSAYLGKVRSNFLGTEFTIFDTGNNPSKKSATRDNVREQLGVILYQSNILGSKGPRKMRVLLPVVNQCNELLQWKPMGVRPI